jgi:hypothetical protein
MATEAEMMADLEAADAAGDSQLAQHIADKIKALRQPSSKLDMEAMRTGWQAPERTALQGLAAKGTTLANDLTFGMLPTAIAASQATLGSGGNWRDRFGAAKQKAEDDFRRQAGLLSQVERATGGALGGMATGHALGRTLAPLSGVAETWGGTGATLPWRVAAGLGDTALVSGTLGAAHTLGTDKSMLSGAWEALKDPTQYALGAGMPLATGLGRSAPVYEARARQRTAEALAPSTETARALQEDFGTGAGTGVENAAKTLLGEGKLIRSGQTIHGLADEVSALKQTRGRRLDDFLEKSPAEVDPRGMVEDIRGLIDEYRKSHESVNPKSDKAVAELEAWADNVEKRYGAKGEPDISGKARYEQGPPQYQTTPVGEGQPGQPGSWSSETPPPKVTPAGEGQPGQPGRWSYEFDDPLKPPRYRVTPPAEGVPPQPGEVVFGAPTQRVTPPTEGTPPSPGKWSYESPPPKVTPPAEPAVRGLPVKDVENLKTSLTRFVKGQKGKYPNPEAVAAGDPVLSRLYRFSGKLKDRTEAAMSKVSPGHAEEYRRLKGEYAPLETLETATSESSTADMTKRAQPKPSRWKDVGATVVRGLAHNPWLEARHITKLLPEATPLGKAARARDKAQRYAGRTGLGVDAGEVEALIQYLRQRKE